MNTNTEHYQVLVDPRTIEDDETIEIVKEELTNNLTDNVIGEPLEVDRVERLEKQVEQLFKKLNNVDIEMQSLKLENRRLNEKLNERKNKDAKVVTESQTSNMDVDNTQDDKIQQLEVLKRMKQSGFNRSSPQNSPMKKQTQNINCETCGVQQHF